MTSAVVFAYHNVGVRCLSVLLAHGVEVPLVVTHSDDPRERIWFESVAALAARHDIPVITPADPNSPEIVERVLALDPDFLFSFYYRNMLKTAMLAASRRGAFNMHGSLLPKYRGRVPVNWAVIRGERETGATLHEMVAKPDAGRIVDQQAVPILPNDTAAEVFHKVTVAAEMVLDRSFPALANGSAKLRPQDLAQGSYFGGRKPEDGRIDWSLGAQRIHDLVRGVAPPYPGAFTDVGGKRLRILRTLPDPKRSPRTGGPGLYFEAGQWFVDCADGKVLRVLETDGVAPDDLAPHGTKTTLA
jgi:methionyl-tRNA formyltransferase